VAAAFWLSVLISNGCLLALADLFCRFFCHGCIQYCHRNEWLSGRTICAAPGKIGMSSALAFSSEMFITPEHLADQVKVHARCTLTASAPLS
jgi:hypothetical protein